MPTARLFYADTIYALSTAPTKAAVAVVRVSGSSKPVEEILRRICRRTTFGHRRATVAKIFDEHGSSLEKALVTRFEAPHSFTGEEVIEFHTIGGEP